MTEVTAIVYAMHNGNVLLLVNLSARRAIDAMIIKIVTVLEADSGTTQREHGVS